MPLYEVTCLDLPKLQWKEPWFLSEVHLNFQKPARSQWNEEFFCEINFFPDTPFNEPLLGEILRTTNFLVRVRKKKLTNLITGIQFFLRISKTIKIRSFANFQYLPFCENLISEKQFPRETIVKALKKISLQNQSNFSFPVDFIFSLNSGLFIYKEDLLISQKKKNEKNSSRNFRPILLNKTVIPMGIDQRSLCESFQEEKFAFSFLKENLPKFPFEKRKKEFSSIPFFVLGLFLKFFKKRPVWGYKSIKKFCHPFLRRYIRKTLPLVSYRVNGRGLIGDSWVRLGYDPRKDSRFVVYDFEKTRNDSPFYTA